MASKLARQRHAAIDRDRESLVLIGARAASRIGIEARAAALAAVDANPNNVTAIAHAVGIALDQITPILTDGMVAAHLRGRYRMVLSARDALRRQQRQAIAAGPFGNVLDWLRRKLHIGDAHVTALQATYTPAASRAAGESIDWVQDRIRVVMTRIIERGDHVTAGVKALRDEFDRIGITTITGGNGRILNRGHLLETLYRTQVNMAYSAGRWQAAQDPDIDAILWGWEYMAIDDSRVRPTHLAMDGTRLPKGDAMWQTNTPPMGWNCRCSTVEIFHGDESDGQRLDTNQPPKTQVDGEPVRAVPDAGFDFNPGVTFVDLIPTLPL